MKHKLLLVSLNQQQIESAKKVNSSRKHITHALVCGPHGNLFGTEKFCRKYYSVWVNVFPLLFDEGVETDNFEIADYETTFNLVTQLTEIHDPLEQTSNYIWQEIEKSQKMTKTGFFHKLFGAK